MTSNLCSVPAAQRSAAQHGGGSGGAGVVAGGAAALAAGGCSRIRGGGVSANPWHCAVSAVGERAAADVEPAARPSVGWLIAWRR